MALDKRRCSQGRAEMLCCGPVVQGIGSLVMQKLCFSIGYCLKPILLCQVLCSVPGAGNKVWEEGGGHESQAQHRCPHISPSEVQELELCSGFIITDVSNP